MKRYEAAFEQRQDELVKAAQESEIDPNQAVKTAIVDVEAFDFLPELAIPDVGDVQSRRDTARRDLRALLDRLRPEAARLREDIRGETDPTP